MTRYLLAIDQGTTSSRAIVFAENTTPVFVEQQEFKQIYPKNGWVEHDPEEIWRTTLQTATKAVNRVKGKISAIGITNQRETTIIWDRKTGKPIYNAIVWQDRRTAEFCAGLKKYEKTIHKKTGLLIDPYFSASKIKWIVENVKGAKEKAAQGRLAFGTIDSFLIWRLTGGKIHATDATNASRSMLYNIDKNCWDKELLKIFGIDESLLPEVKNSIDDFGFAEISSYKIPIKGVAGDQQAALIGQGCIKAGMVKSTYGTGCFMVLNTGQNIIYSRNKLLTTIAYRINGKTTYAVEGSIFIAGAVVQWLRDKMKFIKKSSDVEKIITSTKSEGVYVVPAFTGLGAPYWNANARGAIFGIRRDTGYEEISKAAVEAVAYQTHDLKEAMEKDGIASKVLRVDGGMAKNNWFVQFLADILNIRIDRPKITETTALGAAMLAGIGVGVYKNLDECSQKWQCEKTFTPKMAASKRKQLVEGWKTAVKKLLT